MRAWMLGALVALGCGGGGAPRLETITIVPGDSTFGEGVTVQADAIGHFSDGTTKDLLANATWSSSDPTIATIDAKGVVRTVGAGTTTIAATQTGVTGTTTLTVTGREGFALPAVGVYTQFEDRTSTGGFFSGQLLHLWSQTAPEVALQLDTLRALGTNVITFELRATDPNASPSAPFVPPDCPENPALGIDYPQPAASDLANLKGLLDELDQRGMKMWLRLVNTHMEERPPTNNQTWLTATLQAVGSHPALDLVLFEGAQHVDPVTGKCNFPAEPPLWTGPTMPEATYVKWAIALGLSLGVPARKLSAECIVGDYNTTTMQPNTSGEFTDNHFWWPLTTEKAIFDSLGIAAADRTYALSMYEHRKCLNVFAGVACTDESPHAWADETLAAIVAAVGPGPRVVAAEMGNNVPVDAAWSTEHAYESLLRLMQKYAVDGGAFWRWTSFTTQEDGDATLADPIKRRGVDFVYNPVEKVLVDVGGWHVGSIANGSFESGSDGAVPDHWTASGGGTAARYDLTTEAGEPEVPWRGTHALRLVASDAMSATSESVAVTPALLYTTTAALRFGFADDLPTATIEILYLQAGGAPSAVRASDELTFHRADAPVGFGTFPVQYTPPADAAAVAVRIGVARNGSTQPATLDADDVR